MKQMAIFLHRRRDIAQSKLRIGYLSPDIRARAESQPEAALFSQYDSEAYEVCCYALSPEDDYSRRVMQRVDRWRNFTGMAAAAAARLIYEDQVDILVDLSGPDRGRSLPILAFQPAPIQLTIHDTLPGPELVQQNLCQRLQLGLDAAGCMKKIEAGYRLLWARYCAQQLVPSYRDVSALLPRMMEFAQMQDWLQAMAAADAVLAARPDTKRPLELAAGVYIDGGDAMAAMRASEQLLAACGAYGYALFLQARAFYMRGDFWSTEQAAQRSLQAGALADWQEGLLYNILGRVYKELGEAEKAAEYSKAALPYISRREEKAAEYSNYLFNLYYLQKDAAFMQAAAKGYADLFREVRPFRHARRNRHVKLRIGYISPDFCMHVVAYFSYVLLHDYDRQRFEVTCYANCHEDGLSEQFKTMADHWCNIYGLTSEQAAQKIYADEIDILFDLSGHTQHNCLPVLAWKPAPIQISGIGFMGTTGLPAVDYFLGDCYTDEPALQQKLPVVAADWQTPPELPRVIASAEFTERLLLLPHSHFCYASYDAPAQPYPAPYRQQGHITFGCFNNFSKVTDVLLRLWAQILAQVPGAHLFLKSAIFNDAYGTKKALARLRAAGIPLACVETGRHEPGYLREYARVDIALDTYPYPGGATTCDALYMGVPVVTLAGKRHNARFGYSLLMNVGLSDCCAFSAEEYVLKAVVLARDGKRLSWLHQNLRRIMEASPVMDGALYMNELEAAYTRLWGEWLQASAPSATSSDEQCAALRQSLLAGQWGEVVQRAGRLSGTGQCQPAVFASAAFAYYQLKDYSRAVFFLRRMLNSPSSLQSDHYFLLGSALRETVQHLAAKEAYRYGVAKAREEGNRAIGFKNQMLLALQCFILGEPEDSDAYLAAYEAAEDIRDRCNMYSSYLLTFNNKEVDEAQLFEKHLRYADIFACPAIKGFTYTPAQLAARSHQRLRVGYLSPDFRQHVMFYFFYQILAGHDRDKVEVYCYNLCGAPDGFTEKVKKAVDVWRDVAGQPYAGIAQQIYADEIDILFDLAGHSADSGLPVLAWTPAPVQLSGIGYMATTGLRTVDYFLTDAWTDPVGAGHEAYFTEQLLRVRSQFCYTGRSDVPQPQGASAKQRGWVLFGVFNHYRKLTDEMLLAWKAILEQVPASKLLLKSQVLVSAPVVQQAFNRLAGLGFDMDRVLFEPATSDYMERYLDVDIALDTYPYPGGGTTCDALYMGVPVITRYGARHSTRFGLSILQNAGLGELAADSVPAYIERAVGLARDPELLDILHQRLRGMMLQSPLMDARGYVQELEENYQRIWQQAIERR